MPPSQVFHNIFHLQHNISNLPIAVSISIDSALNEIKGHLIKHNITAIMVKVFPLGELCYSLHEPKDVKMSNHELNLQIDH
jgi:hypothetical protein